MINHTTANTRRKIGFASILQQKELGRFKNQPQLLLLHCQTEKLK